MRRWRVLGGLALLGLVLMVARCGRNEAQGQPKRAANAGNATVERTVTRSELPARKYKDATEIPGAIVIWPKLDPNMSYDPETERTTDKRTGEYFISQMTNPINRTFEGGIYDKNGKFLLGYKYRYNAPRLPNGEARTIYEIIWSVRGEDVIGKMMVDQIAGRERARHDSVERVASFLRAQRVGYYNGVEKGQIALVDRRMDDLRGEMK